MAQVLAVFAELVAFAHSPSTRLADALATMPGSRCPFHHIAAPGACGKARVMPHNGWPDTGHRSEALNWGK